MVAAARQDQLNGLAKLVDCMHIAKSAGMPQLTALAEPPQVLDQRDILSVVNASVVGGATLSQLDVKLCCEALKVLFKEMRPALVPRAAHQKLKKSVKTASKTRQQSVRDVVGTAALDAQSARLLTRLLSLLASLDAPSVKSAAVWAPLLGMAGDTQTIAYLIEERCA